MKNEDKYGVGSFLSYDGVCEWEPHGCIFFESENLEDKDVVSHHCPHVFLANIIIQTVTICSVFQGNNKHYVLLLGCRRCVFCYNTWQESIHWSRILRLVLQRNCENLVRRWPTTLPSDNRNKPKKSCCLPQDERETWWRDLDMNWTHSFKSENLSFTTWWTAHSLEIRLQGNPRPQWETYLVPLVVREKSSWQFEDECKSRIICALTKALAEPYSYLMSLSTKDESITVALTCPLQVDKLEFSYWLTYTYFLTNWGGVCGAASEKEQKPWVQVINWNWITCGNLADHSGAREVTPISE